MVNVPAGWYADPDDPRMERWWDGAHWSDHHRPGPARTLPPPPSANFSVEGANKPDSLLAWSIVSTLFCCLPFGIAAILQSARVDGLWASGDYAGAHAAARKARYWMKWAAAVSIGLVTGYVVIVLYALSIETGTLDALPSGLGPR